jgi:hypothetical protein
MPLGRLLNPPHTFYLRPSRILATFFITILFELGKSVMHLCLPDRTQKICCWPFLLWEAFSTPTPSYDPSLLKASSPYSPHSGDRGLCWRKLHYP